MYSRYPHQNYVDSVLSCYAPPSRPLITYEVVEAQNDDVMRVANAQHPRNSTPSLEDSVDSANSLQDASRPSPQMRPPRRVRTRRPFSRQLVPDEEEMLKVPSPDTLNSMMRGVELNGELP